MILVPDLATFLNYLVFYCGFDVWVNELNAPSVTKLLLNLLIIVRSLGFSLDTKCIKMVGL